MSCEEDDRDVGTWEQRGSASRVEISVQQQICMFVLFTEKYFISERNTQRYTKC